MAVRRVCMSAWRTGTEIEVNNARTLTTTAGLWLRRALAPGPLPNQDIDVKNLESLEKYHSYKRYFRQAQEAHNKPVWWHTYRKYVEKANPDHGAEQVDIGFPLEQPNRTKQVKERKQVMKENKKNMELERAARLRTLKIPLERVQQMWEQTSGPHHIRRLAEHYGIYKDLFPNAFFLPIVPLKVHYGQNSSVHYGNILTPTEAETAPQISFEAEEGTLWTLLLTCPDEHLLDGEAEYVHWMMGNIPAGAVQSGDELCHYLPPFPPRGTGFHRYIFVLFKQNGPIDFRDNARPSPCHSLEERTFKTVEWYKKHQEHMTPAGLAFFQSQWDASVTHTFHHTLNMKEPVFEFIRPPVYHPPQVKFPHRQPLRYLDRYRDGQPHTYGIY
ncbi:39S ribosomal protein L38, mitochondrial [Periophthalmus magnuspinnatus]|uniref:39S ribosomal protein L38, mitochondrial n=1 Tax=Periophthalmus magnuspinnatus TaxID=409849 RepID=UPI00145A824C|nr:39S ribosomal protein L38, mitochondrial [Periophthalmus magnuspinnatus]